MFTGIVEELGTIAALERGASGARLSVRCRKVLEGTRVGDSLAVNGVCLTGVDLQAGGFSAHVAPETLRRTNLGALAAGAPVNLERALSPSGRLGGHIVQGHVDATGEFLGLDDLGEENWWLRVRYPAELDPYFVFKGSVAIDGVSLTIADLSAGVLAAAILPHTFRHTTLGRYRPGARLNLETDILAKHVEKLVRKLRLDEPLTVDKLREMGY
jgi:riboflavin synthase